MPLIAVVLLAWLWALDRTFDNPVFPRAIIQIQDLGTEIMSGPMNMVEGMILFCVLAFFIRVLASGD